MALSLGASSVEELAAELGALLKAKPPTSLAEAIKLLATAMDLRHAKPKLRPKARARRLFTAKPLSSAAPGRAPTLLTCPSSNAGRWMPAASSLCPAS